MNDLTSYRGARPPADVLHLDTAACGRQSRATLDATAAHARLEATTGAYVAAARVGATLDRLRADVGALVGMPAASVAFVESATAALRALLTAWPLPAGAKVGVLPSEWGPNLELLLRCGLEPVMLDCDAAGHLDVDALAPRASALAAVHLTQVASHRTLAHHLAAVVDACRAAGVPLWVDAAQAVGHVECAGGADAVYATGRKWLAGPRGVGFLAVREDRWTALDVLRAALDDEPGRPPTAFLESSEAHVAGRVGLANAVREFVDAGPQRVFDRLAEVGRLTRAALDDLPGWQVVGTPADRGAITSIRPTAGQDVAATRERLLAEHGILTTACVPARAPADMPVPLLRVSPHVDLTDDDLDRLCRALAATGSDR